MDQRTEFAMKAEAREIPFRQLCRDYGVSPKTGYKWIERFREGGVAAMQDQSSPAQVQGPPRPWCAASWRSRRLPTGVRARSRALYARKHSG